MQARSFEDLQRFAVIAREYREIRSAHPLIPARKVYAFASDDDRGAAHNIKQYICRHDWVISDETDRCYCSDCGMDGDA